MGIAPAQSHVATWYVLNYVGHSTAGEAAQKEVDRHNSRHGADLQLFAPTYVVRVEKNGTARMKQVKLMFHYVFVRGTLNEVKSLCSHDNGFSFLINRSSTERYAVISDSEMDHFKTIARAYQNCLPYYSLDDVVLQDGDLVEVVNGDFPGLIGTYMPRAKSKSGNIILQVYNNIGTIAYNIKASDVRVLEFSKNATRANDQIDAFVPQLLKALRHYHADRPLPISLASQLNIFCQRMEVVRINNHKLDAKLQALLYVANLVLGNKSAAETYMAKYQRLKAFITNLWTEFLISLIFAVANRNIEALTECPPVNNPAGVSKAQMHLMEEYAFYTQSTIAV